MKREVISLFAVIFLLIMGGAYSGAYGASTSASLDANVGSGSAASIDANARANASADSGTSSGTGNTIEAEDEVNNYVRGLALERKKALLNRINTRHGLNLAVEDIESKRMRVEVRESILSEMREIKIGEMMEIRPARVREEVRTRFIANLSLYVHNMTLEERADIVARLNARYGFNLTADDLDNRTIRSEVRTLIDAELRSRLEAMKEQRIRAMRLSDLAKERGWIHVEGRNITVREFNNDKKELIVGRINAKYRINITADEFDGNITALRTRLSNGKNASVKIMPDMASEVALTRLRAKCLERNCSVELKEVGNGGRARLAYEVKTEKDSRVLFLFKKNMMVSARVDAETGQVIEVRKPWWAFLARENNANGAEIKQEVQARASAQAEVQ